MSDGNETSFELKNGIQSHPVCKLALYFFKSAMDGGHPSFVDQAWPYGFP